MSNWLFATTIKRKLTLIIMLTCSVALVLACAAILFFEHAGTRQILKHNTQVMADVIGANSQSALTFKDKTAAMVVLLLNMYCQNFKQCSRHFTVHISYI